MNVLFWRSQLDSRSRPSPTSGAHARMLARRVGAEHVEASVTEDDFWRLLPEIASAMDDPAADYAVVPTYVLGRLASRHVKVVLTGEGGDELFAGYGRYRRARRPRWLGGRAMRRRGAFDGLGVLREPAARGGTASRRSRGARPATAGRPCKPHRRPIAPTGCPTACC